MKILFPSKGEFNKGKKHLGKPYAQTSPKEYYKVLITKI